MLDKACSFDLSELRFTYLVVVWERNDGGTHAEDHAWMDLTVRVGVKLLLLFGVLVQVRHVHGNHGRLFLLDVKELDQAFLESVVEVHA